MLCKVYDSADHNTLGNDSTPREEEKSIKQEEDTFKSIINSNYRNSSKKQSKVISKVKLWDELVESGKTDHWTEKWDSNYN
jgi:hypothetical protein